MGIKQFRMFLFVVALFSYGCATVPPEAVTAARQLEKNLEIIKQNNLAVLDSWYKVSVDYWTEKVGQEGVEKIVSEAKAQDPTIDLNKDYVGLVQQVLKEYRENFLIPLSESYQSYRDGILNDFSVTINTSQKLGNLLESVARVTEERRAVLQSLKDELAPKVKLFRP